MSLSAIFDNEASQRAYVNNLFLLDFWRVSPGALFLTITVHVKSGDETFFRGSVL